MHITLPATVRTIAVTGAIALAAFAGGAYWNHTATPAAAEEPGTPPAREQRGWLGMRVAPLTDAIATELGITKQDGLAVLSVVPESPAAKAGVQDKDVVKSLNGAAVTDMTAALASLKALKPGDTVAFQISRNNATQTISVTAGPAPARNGPLAGRAARQSGGGFGMLPSLPELEGIPPAEMFDHLISGSFKLKDKDNKDLTISMIAGKVVSASDTSVTLVSNGGGDQTFTITGDTKMRGKGSELQADAKVVVITKNGSSTALSISTPGQRAGRGGVAGAIRMPLLTMPGATGWLQGLTADGGLRAEIERRFQQMPFRHDAQRPEPQT